MFEYLDKIKIHVSSTIRQAMECISQGIILNEDLGISFVVDDDSRLLGVITDGDIRRGLLSGKNLEDKVTEVMTRKPVTTFEGSSYHQLLRMFEKGVRHIPVIDQKSNVCDLILYSDLHLYNSPTTTIFRAKAPVRISFAGGGTDMTSVFERSGGAVISVTIDRYCYADLIVRNDSKIVIKSHDYKQTVEVNSFNDLIYDGRLDLVKAAIKVCKPDFGFELYTRSDIAPGSGLGGSATLAVAVIGLFETFRYEHPNDYRIADLAFQAERVELGIQGGWQDQYASVFGGLNYIEFDDREVVVQPLRLAKRVRYELESNLLLCFTGITRNSGGVHASNIVTENSSNSYSYKSMIDLSKDLRKSLLKGDLQGFGELLDKAWWLKKEMFKEVTNDQVDKIYRIARNNGAVGGKLLGAGRGGYLLFYCDPLKKNLVSQALRKQGFDILSFNLDFNGLQLWHSDVS